jgi:hypothetical protein
MEEEAEKKNGYNDQSLYPSHTILDTQIFANPKKKPSQKLIKTLEKLITILQYEIFFFIIITKYIMGKNNDAYLVMLVKSREKTIITRKQKRQVSSFPPRYYRVRLGDNNSFSAV